LNSVLRLIGQFFPPDLSIHYLRAEMPAVGQTIEIAAAGVLLALMAGLLIGTWVGAGLPASRMLYGALVLVRSFPDIVLALLCVVVFGVGSGPGMIAIGLFYGAAIGKIYSDLLRAAPPGPVQALQAVGAGRISVALFAQLPLRMRDLVSYGAFEFESAVRAAVIVGAVGGGGLGVELIGTINEFDYRRACTLILLLIMAIALLDRLASVVKRRPVLVIFILPLMALAVWQEWPSMLA
jgi:phosphonate transport system permease protein